MKRTFFLILFLFNSVALASTGILEINSTPDGASVFIDGVLVGKTPYANPELSTGTHEIKVILSDEYPAQTTTINLDSVNPVQKSFSFTSKKAKFTAIEESASIVKYVGSMQIASIPSGIDAYIDGEKLKKTPIGYKDISVGEYEISFAYNGNIYKELIKVEKNMTTKIIFNANKKQISSKINSNFKYPYYYIQAEPLYIDGIVKNYFNLILVINRDSLESMGHIACVIDNKVSYYNLNSKITLSKNGVVLNIFDESSKSVGQLEINGDLGQDIKINKEFDSDIPLSTLMKIWNSRLIINHKLYHLSASAKEGGRLYGPGNFLAYMEESKDNFDSRTYAYISRSWGF